MAERPRVHLRQTLNGRFVLTDDFTGDSLYFESGDAALAEKVRREAAIEASYHQAEVTAEEILGEALDLGEDPLS